MKNKNYMDINLKATKKKQIKSNNKNNPQSQVEIKAEQWYEVSYIFYCVEGSLEYIFP